MADEHPTRYIDTRHGARVAYTVMGRGERTLLLANGLGGRLYTWQPLVDALQDHYRIIGLASRRRRRTVRVSSNLVTV